MSESHGVFGRHISELLGGVRLKPIVERHGALAHGSLQDNRNSPVV
ncbi:MAG: hypothetical protein WC974_01640 [Thermoplasmata archaeon]